MFSSEGGNPEMGLHTTIKVSKGKAVVPLNLKMAASAKNTSTVGHPQLVGNGPINSPVRTKLGKLNMTNPLPPLPSVWENYT